MKITIEIACDNAAFHPYSEDEVVRILRDLADRLDGNRVKFKDLAADRLKLRDINGNSAGSVKVEIP